MKMKRATIYIQMAFNICSGHVIDLYNEARFTKAKVRPFTHMHIVLWQFSICVCI